MAVLKNCVFNYVKIKNPALEYGKKGVADSPFMEREFVVDVLVPADTAKKLRKKYKGVASIKEARTYDAKQYEESFRTAPPSDAMYLNGDDEYTVVKFKKRAYYTKTKTANTPPKVVGVKGQKDNNGKTVGIQIEAGNGSLGCVQFKERPWEYEGKAGLSLDLVALQITDLIEYVANDTLEFEMEEDDDDFDGDDFANDDSGSSQPVKTEAPEEDEIW